MSLKAVTGDDHLRVSQSVQRLKADQSGVFLSDLNEAIKHTLTISLFSQVIICYTSITEVKKLTEAVVDRLQKSNTLLVLVVAEWDNRIKICKVIESERFQLPNKWNKRQIKANISLIAKQRGLELSQAEISYLAGCYQTNFMAIDNVLQCLVMSNFKQLAINQRDIKLYCLSSTVDVFELANKILQQDSVEVAKLADKISFKQTKRVINQLIFLMVRNLKVRLALDDPRPLTDKDIAQIAAIKNSKQVYYLRRDLATVTASRLHFICESLFAMERSLVRGQKDIALKVQLHLITI